MKIRALLGNRDSPGPPPILNPEDLLAIGNAEIDLLRSVDFNMSFDLPVTHFERVKQRLMAEIPNEAFVVLCQSVVVDICLLICSAYYLDLPPEVAAAAAIDESVNTEVIPTETFEWLASVRERYGGQLFDLARASISQERERTVQKK
jgi:hypothetical protein